MTCNLNYIIIENMYVYMQFKTITLNTRHQLHNYSITLRDKMKNKKVYDTSYFINSKRHYIIVF